MHLDRNRKFENCSKLSSSWIYKITIGGKRKEIGLGSYPEVSLKDARELARLKYEAIKSGLDPVAEQRAKKAALVAEQAQHITFAEYSKRFITKQAKEYKTTEQVRRLAQQLTEYVHPHIGHLFLKDIKREHIRFNGTSFLGEGLLDRLVEAVQEMVIGFGSSPAEVSLDN